MRTQWLITKDYIADETKRAPCNSNAKGVMGPRGMVLTEEQIRRHPERIKFKMYDDDKNLYYEGLMVLGEEGDEFGPLDDFGMPNAGCTHIKIKNAEGEWEIV